MSHHLQLNLNDLEKEILKEIRDTDYQTLMKGKDKNGIPFLKHIFQLHLKIFGQTCSTCPAKITGYIQKLKQLNPIEKMENTENKPKAEFKLNDGVIIPVAGTSEAYSKHNITDAIALKLLVDNPNRKALFSKLPDNIDELIEAGVVQEEIEDDLIVFGENKLTIEETISLLEKINVTTKATTVTGINKKIAELSEEQKLEFDLLVTDAIALK